MSKEYMNGFTDILGNSMFNPIGIARRISSNIPTDIVENDDNYVLTAFLPGFNKEDIEVNYTEGVLRINGSKEERNEQYSKYLVKEIYYCTSFSRNFNIPNIEENGISGKMSDGVLVLTLPKKPSIPPTKINIE